MSNIIDLLTIVLGFSAIIFIHEAGHFVAARWAGVRVLAFALGFGPAIFSYRKGMGFSAGTSEPRYRKLAREQGDGRGLVPGVSATEYRLNALPLGGYVKMLGQEDADPSARSDQPDSYNNAPIPKRMVIISAGVIMNLITAALMFIVVFFAGLKTESARLGYILPGSPASVAKPVGHDGAPGLRSGDLVVSIDGQPVEAFKDITLAVAMSRSESALQLEVQRDGKLLRYSATPKADPGTRMLALGVGPGATGQLLSALEPSALVRLGLPEAVKPGMTLANGLDAHGLDKLFEASNGQPVTFAFEGGAGQPVSVTLAPEAEFEQAQVMRADGKRFPVEHLLGLVPVMTVDKASETGAKAGLRDGDVFARLGEVEWPSQEEGIREIQHPGRTAIDAVVLRAGAEGSLSRVALKAMPVRDGRIGFVPGSTLRGGTLVTRWPRVGVTNIKGELLATPAGASAGILSGSMITAVNGQPVATMTAVRDGVKRAARAGDAEVALTVKLPDASGTVETKTIALNAETKAALADLGWRSPLDASAFELDEVLLKRSTPQGAIAKGFDETRKMVLTTYLTFARLFQGSVKVEHLKGPIGIAHVGTLIAERGWVWVLFFMAALSINLAVVNFLPLPIVDGGHFLFLCYEGLTGKPVSVAVQNAATIAGLVLIGSVFLVTTYQDLMNLLR